MSVRDKIIQQGLKHVLDSKALNTCYMLDEQGKEVPITTSMVRSVCYQLLKQCRSIKN